ncbi:MAG: N-acetylmuramoyl-L-alanine amidase [Methylococcaceae bacterium]|nr:N-acetylmuramoyl-L-alanine amidase [Methylococcaceae bacterium]
MAIDVGHSTMHPGAISAYGKPEFAFNVDLAKSIQGVVTSYGIPSLQIGNDGQTTDLTQRTDRAHRAGAKFFLSVHHDSVQPQFLKSWQWQGKTNYYSEHASGFSLFVSRKNPFLPASLHCASAIGSVLKQMGFHFTSHHAESMPGESKEWADKYNGVYYSDDLIVLKTAKMPAVLFEAGVIVNREEHIIQKPELRNKLAEAVTKGLLNCGVLINGIYP